MDKNDSPLSKLRYRFSEVRDDVNFLLRQKHRASLSNISLKPKDNDLTQRQYERKGRSSLVPIRLSFNSFNVEPSRTSDLFKDMS